MEYIDDIKSFIPEFVDKLVFRYKILDYISINYPIGRRNISNYFNISERYIRNEMDTLLELGFIETIKSGAIITDLGINMLDNLRELINKLNQNEQIEKELEKKLKIKKVIICQSYDDVVLGKKSLAKTASEYFLKKIFDNAVIAISGGTTLRTFVDNLDVKKSFKNLSVIPARGSIGNGLEYQSNVVANDLSKKLNASFFGSFLPDYIDEITFDKLKSLKEVSTLLSYLDRIDIFVFGIGRADIMANRRSLSIEEINMLNEKQAVSEAFGNYFDINGNIVYSSNTIGLDIKKYLKINEVIAVAGFDDKEKAIISICRIRKDMTLITDENTAKKILSIL